MGKLSAVSDQRSAEGGLRRLFLIGTRVSAPCPCLTFAFKVLREQNSQIESPRIYAFSGTSPEKGPCGAVQIRHAFILAFSWRA
jgi:hypothetical protein